MMAPFLTTGQLARQLGVQAQTVRGWCEDGKIPGALLVGDRWMVPADAVRPEKRPTGRRPRKTESV